MSTIAPVEEQAGVALALGATATPLMTYMNQHISSNLKLEGTLYLKEGTGWKLQDPDVQSGTGPPLVRDVDYRLRLAVRNVGKEVFFKNVQIRVAPEHFTPPRVYLFTDESYGPQKARGDGPIWDKELRPMGNDYPGEKTPDLDVFFKLAPGAGTGSKPLFAIGIYAEIVPQGNRWFTKGPVFVVNWTA